MYHNSNVVFQSNTSNLEVLMDACFPRQHKAHVEAYRYHQNVSLRDQRNAAIDAGLADELVTMHARRSVKIGAV